MIDTDQGDFKPLRVVCCSIQEMGLFIPMSHIAHALIEKGHEVFFLSNNDSYNGGKGSQILNDIGCKNQIFTADTKTREEAYKKPENIDDDIDNKWFTKILQPLFKDEIEKINPDIIVCDFFTRIGVHIGDELGIPVIINMPALISYFKESNLDGTIDLENASVCCGQVCIKQNALFCAYKLLLVIQKNPERAKYWINFNKRVVLWNTFIGLDPAYTLPPNYVLTGPLTLP